jgi:hypothetical protein
MFFGKRKPEPRRRQTDAAGSNGPMTPAISETALRKALTHAAFRDPSVERRRFSDLRASVRTLERTAACVDLAMDRLGEAAEAVANGTHSESAVMRGLLTARIEEVLDSLERVAAMAQDGEVNLLSCDGRGLHLALEHGGFRYALNPVDVRRGPRGLDIPALSYAFDDPDEVEAVEAAIARGQRKLAQFSDRLAHDAAMLAGLVKAMRPDLDLSDIPDAPPPALPLPEPELRDEPLPEPSQRDFSDVPFGDVGTTLADGPEPDWMRRAG